MLLLLVACAARPAPPPAALPAGSTGEPSLLGGPAAMAEAASPAGTLLPLDEAGLATLLANPGPAPLVVNFWATWCGPCVRELADLRAVAEARPDVRFALVNVEGPRQRDAVLRFLAAQGGDLPAFQLDTDDPSGLLARAVPAWPDLIPVTLVIDPGGAIRSRFDGALDAPSLDRALPP